MELSAHRIATREKLILVGLYLSKYDSIGLKRLGFDSFVEACNVVGYAMGSRPASIKNYRDEFDPLFPNRRKGWHKRKTRDYCMRVFEEYRSLDFESFAGLVESFVGYDESASSELQPKRKSGSRRTNFAQRLITGLAAERYFESVRATLSEFKGYGVQNTTGLGCGYDFRLGSDLSEDFLAVEVKGLNGRTGTSSLTPKEHDIATALGDRFFLFVVRNFRESPFHEVFQNPLSGSLKFRKKERVMVQVSRLAKL
jgi:hypothetical protein